VRTQHNTVIHDRDQLLAAEAAVPKRQQAVKVARIAAGLADPNRLSLALVLRASKQATVTDLAELTGIERSVASRHLRKLQRAGLTRSRRQGKLSIHQLSDDGRRLLDFLAPPAAPPQRPTTMPGPERFRR
jgi:DNA-binding transcriptional ArsR family regulator